MTPREREQLLSIGRLLGSQTDAATLLIRAAALIIARMADQNSREVRVLIEVGRSIEHAQQIIYRALMEAQHLLTEGEEPR